MKTTWLLLLVVGLMALAACGDTASPEPAVVSDSGRAIDSNASVTATPQATSTVDPTATSAPRPTSTPTTIEAHTPVPTAVSIPPATPTPDPELTADSYYEIALARITADDADDALVNLSKAIDLNPNYVDAYFLRGLIYGSQYDFDKAIADFEKVVELDPSHTDAKAMHADAYAARGADYALEKNYDKAIADFERAIELDPDKAEFKAAAAATYFLRGATRYEEGDNESAFADLDRAISDIEKIIELDPDNSEVRIAIGEAYLVRGIAHFQGGNYDRAIADLERAIELENSAADLKEAAAYAYLRRGVSHAEGGDHDRAIADFNRAVEIEPENSRVRNARKFIQPSPVPDAFAGEVIEWSLCEFILECGFVEVPADYRNPDAGSIKIAVNVRRADHQDQRIGYLFVNPGGPGASGLELVQDSEFAFADELMARFDIIGFDPRGVGASEPEFACGAPGEQLALLNSIDGDIDTPEETATGEAAANMCIESMGPVGGLLHSEYVARDMDEIRRALGAEQVSYLGYSYGSTLGVWYATLFPESVRAMVVDGADNPVDRADTQQERIDEAVEEWAGFEDLMEQALAACDSAECPMYNEGDPIDYYKSAVAKLHLVNSAAGDVPDAGFLAVLTPLYGEELWPVLWKSLYELNENDDPAILLEFAAIQLGDDLTAPNFTAHVNCLDGLVLYPDIDRATRFEDSDLIDEAIAERLPLIDAIYPSAPSACSFYDQFAPAPLNGPLDGSGVPILVVGNHTDPTTSFGESEELVTDTLSNGYLLETSHASHVVYPDNDCVNDHVHRALIEAVYPDKRVFCERED